MCLALVCALALSDLFCAAASLAATPAGECANGTQDPVCEYLANQTQAAPVSTSSSTAPGAIEPLPVNPVIEAEFEAHIDERRQRGGLAASVAEADVRLLPGLEGGWDGWCLSVRTSAQQSTRCGIAPTTREQIGYESWEAGGRGTRGIALLNAPAEAVAVDDAGAAEGAVAVPGVPGVSAAVVEIAAPFPAQSQWFDEFEPVYRGMRSSGSRGFSAPEHAYTAGLAAVSWRAPQPPPKGACSISAAGLAGLKPRFGHVVTSVPPTLDIAGVGFVSCIDTEYSLAHSSLDAAVLLSAAEPGSVAPVSLPGATPVPHHPSLFTAPGWNGQILARRVGNAWLAVEGGAGLRERVKVLLHLRTSVHL
jgi:hypothetical protein